MLMLGVAQAQVPPGGLPIPTFADFGDPNDQFGSVLDADDDWLVASGSFGEAFYVYQRVDNRYVRRQRIVPPTLGQAFFRTPSLLGDRLVLSRPIDPRAPVATTGTVYVYERVDSAAPFELTATLRNSDAQPLDRFGYGLAQSADRIFIGASSHDEMANIDQGVVYVFRLVGGNWVEEARLTPADAGPNDRFGQDLDFDGEDLLVGSQRHVVDAERQGAVYVYRLESGSWTQVQKLIEPTPDVFGTRFGYSLSAQGGRLFAHGQCCGAYYLYSRDGQGVWGDPRRITDQLDGTGLLDLSLDDADLQDDRLMLRAYSAISFSPFLRGPSYAVAYRLDTPNGNPLRAGRIELPEVSFDPVRSPSADLLLVGRAFANASPSSPRQGSIQVHPLDLQTGANGIGPATSVIWHGTGNTPDRTGEQLAADGDWAVLASPGADGDGGLDAGAIHFLQYLPADGWQLRQSISGNTPFRPGPCALALYDNLALVGHCLDAVDGIAGRGRVEVFQRQADEQWSLLCELVPSGTDALGFGGALAVGANGIWVRRSLTSNPPNPNRFGFDSYALPGAACGGPTPAAEPPLDHTYRDVAMAGTRAVVNVNRISGDVTLATPMLRSFELIGGSWQPAQDLALPGFNGFNVADSSALALDGDGLAAQVRVPVGGSVDLASELWLFEHDGSSFGAARTINVGAGVRFAGSLALRGERLLVTDDSIGSNGGVAWYDFASAVRIAEVTVPDLELEDELPGKLAMPSAERGLLGWPLRDRNGYNNAGLVYALVLPPLRAQGPPAFTLEPIESVPRPDRIFDEYFEFIP
jgi:hypothetical protein